MAGTALLGRLTWLAAEVVEARPETARARSIVLLVPEWAGHRPGQHVDLRLTAEDGYQAQRSYSIASPVDDKLITITVELVPDGEVSPFLVEELRVGDRIELRGPIGGYFVWEPALGGPLQLIAGGSGLVPLMAMVRSQKPGAEVPTRLLLSARSVEDVLYGGELGRLTKVNGALQVFQTLTRSRPDGWQGYSGRVDRAMLEELTWPSSEEPHVFVCGPTGFVEAVATHLIDLGHEPGRVKTERFGPSGG